MAVTNGKNYCLKTLNKDIVEFLLLIPTLMRERIFGFNSVPETGKGEWLEKLTHGAF
jgi:hypothetical protein